MRNIAVVLVLVALSAACLGAAETCFDDMDCVPAQCCHASECVHISQAPDCSDIVCAMVCEPGTMDCGQGWCVCEGSECVVEWAEGEGPEE